MSESATVASSSSEIESESVGEEGADGFDSMEKDGEELESDYEYASSDGSSAGAPRNFSKRSPYSIQGARNQGLS